MVLMLVLPYPLHSSLSACWPSRCAMCCKSKLAPYHHPLRFTGYEPRALGLSVDCSSVEGPVDVSRTRLDRLGPTYSSCVDYILSHHHLLTILPAQDQFTAPDRFIRSAPIFAGSLVVVPSLSRRSFVSIASADCPQSRLLRFSSC